MKLFVALVLCLFVSSVTAETVHWQWRDLICKTTNGKGSDKLSNQPADCQIALRETEKDTNRRIAGETNAGCFDVSI